MPTSANTGLLIAQWQNAENMKAVINAFLAESDAEIYAARVRLREMVKIDLADGVWLDRIGARLGLDRPYTAVGGSDPRLGFDGVDDATGFDQAPFAGDDVNAAVFPLPDVVYRKFLKARAVTVLTDGTFQSIVTAAHQIDESVTLVDNLDMSIDIVSNLIWQFRLADEVGALPRAAGVSITYRDRRRFGFDEAGQAFDQGYFTGA